MVYQEGSEASAIANYSEVLSVAFGDQLLLASTDVILAASNSAVTTLSAFARAAGTRAAKASLVSLKLGDGRGGTCEPEPWPWP